MQRKKVLMLGWEFPPYNSGGLGVACEGILRSLIKENRYDITFVLPRKVPVDTGAKTLFADQFKPEEVTFQVFDSLLSPYQTPELYERELNVGDTKAVVYADDIMGEVQRYADYVMGLLKVQEFDMIHAHDWLTVPPALALKKATGKPMVLHIHSTEIDRAGDHGYQEIYNIEKAGIEQADTVIAVSELTKHTIIDRYNGKADKIQVVYNGIDREPHHREPHDEETIKALQAYKDAGYHLVLFVGRLTYQKGVEYLLHAAQKAITMVDKAMFIIVGSGELQNGLIELASYLGISDKVIFAGYIRGRQKKSLYQMADLFIMPSVTEPFGIVALEAVIHSTPVILTKTSGASEVLKHALQVEFGDVDEAAQLMVSALTFPSLRAAMLANSQKSIDDLKWSTSASQITDIYTQHF